MVKSTTFYNLKERKEGEEIALKGFLREDSEGRWVLTDRADIPSCCLGKEEHVVWLSDYEGGHLSHVNEFQGFLEVREGKYFLKDVEFINSDVSYFNFVLLLIFLALLVYSCYRLIFRRLIYE